MRNFALSATDAMFWGWENINVQLGGDGEKTQEATENRRSEVHNSTTSPVGIDFCPLKPRASCTCDKCL